MTAALFEAWFEQCLLPALTQPSVIILDNARFHRMGLLQEMANLSGHIVLPLAPYSPQLNPIERLGQISNGTCVESYLIWIVLLIP